MNINYPAEYEIGDIVFSGVVLFSNWLRFGWCVGVCRVAVGVLRVSFFAATDGVWCNGNSSVGHHLYVCSHCRKTC